MAHELRAIYDERGVEVLPEESLWADKISVCGAQTTRNNTINICKRALAEGIPGDFGECGVLSGGHPAMMAYVLTRYGVQGRRVHLYDSFNGHPMAGPGDGPDEQNFLGVNPDIHHAIPTPNRQYACAGYRWQVELNMKLWKVDQGLLVYHEGFLQDLLPVEQAKGILPQFAVLRVDVDLHVSTLPVAEYLYPRVSPGGYVICDDWGESGPTAARRAWLDTFRAHGWAEPNAMSIPITIGTVWWKKP
jgi:hypothetical protein